MKTRPPMERPRELGARVPMKWIRVAAASVFFAFGAASAWAALRSA
ncbi:MAG: hypothetical protein ACJ79R_05040 [Anaeromyxobacteraceae bacterium]